MKTFATLARHAVTYLVGLLVAWFTLHLTAPEDLKTATDAAHALVEPLVVVAGFVAVILTRLAMPALNKILRRGSGENDGDSAGGLSPCWIVVVVVAAAFMGALPSCAPNTPVTFHLAGPDGDVGYSAKGGLVITGRIRGEK